MRQRSLLVLACGVVLIGAAGCGGVDHPETAAVTGTVTFQGKPVEGAEVMFMAAGAPAATGRTDAQGRFQLMTFSTGDGAVPGEHVVLVTKKEKVVDPKAPDNPYPEERSVLPARYGNPAASGLTARVEIDGENDFPFNLTP